MTISFSEIGKRITYLTPSVGYARKDLLVALIEAGRNIPAESIAILGNYSDEIFNTGGDLLLMHHSIVHKRTQDLYEYGKLCCSAIDAIRTGWGKGIITVADLIGNAYGGGLECALACDYVRVGNKPYDLRFPETSHGFFPFAGAVEILRERGANQQQLYDVLVSGGKLVEPYLTPIRSIQMLRNNLHVHVGIKASVGTLNYSNGSIDRWISQVLNIANSEKSLRRLETLGKRQEKLFSR